MERPTVLLAMPHAEAAAQSELLIRSGFEPIIDLEAALARLQAGERPDLAVLDCDLPAEEGVALYARLHGVNPVPTLLLFGDVLPEFSADAVGSTVADEYAMKPVPGEALVYRLQALLIKSGRGVPTDAGGWTETTSGDGSSIGEAHVMSVFAPKGGVGKTTIALNLAVALREQTHSRVLLFDADVGVGNVTAMLAVPYRMGLADLADSPTEEWTDAAFEQCVSTHEETGVRVLTWGNEPGESERIGVDLLLAALRWAKSHHSFVVIDNHPGYDDRTMAMLTVANEIFLVVTPEVGPLRNSAQFLELARQVGLNDLVKVIVNRANHGIGQAAISEALGVPIAASIVSNGPKAVMAANEGTPVIRKFPRERISTDLHGVARLVTKGKGTEAAGTARRSWCSSLVSRTSNA
jgi:pilus assembly protein CpaE